MYFCYCLPRCVLQVDLASNNIGGYWYEVPQLDRRYYVQTPEGPEAIAEGIRVSQSLNSIDVGFNHIDQAAALELLAAMKEKAMVSIGMVSCELGVEGAKVVAEMAAVSRSLTAVDTRQNGIDGEGAEQLAAAVLGSFSMVTFGEVPMKELRADTLTTLDLSRKDLGPTEAIVLAGLLSTPQLRWSSLSLPSRSADWAVTWGRSEHGDSQLSDITVSLPSFN